MNQENVRAAAQYIKRKRRKSKLHKILIVLGCLVVFCTTYALMLPAITEKNEFFCGMEEHKHSQDCYTLISEQVSVLDCTEQSLGVHIHADTCYDAQGGLICTLADYVAHSHGEECFDAQGNLLCALPEREGHIHTEACYAVVQPQESEEPARKSAAMSAPQTEEPSEAPTEETAAPQTEEPSEAPTEETAAPQTEEPSEMPTEETAAPQTEEPSEAPTEETAAPQTEEPSEAPTEETTVPKTQEPTEAPSEEITTAATEESVEPTEEPETVLICTLPEVQPHVHGEACYHTAPNDLTCMLEENEEHTHGEMCYGVWELVCELEEHTHDHACASNPTADVESEADWTETFSKVELSGDWREDVLSIARTQLGYEESSKNYLISEEGVQRGYTRYGAWYADPYGDWCAMFASFCMHYAQVEGVPLNAACVPWINELKALRLFRTTEDYTPRPADLIFFDWERDGLADHVGLVSEVKQTADGIEIVCIEGNSSNKVQYVTYGLDDSRIAGFGVMDSRRLGYTDCDQQAHTHSEACYGTDGVLTCAAEEHEHSPECGDYFLFYNDGNLRADVSIPQSANLPEDVTLKVETVLPTGEDNGYDAMHDALAEQLTDTDEHISDAVFYRLKLYSAGEIYALSADVKVNVEFSFHSPVFDEATVQGSNAIYAYLIHEEVQPPKRDGEEQISYSAEPAEGETILEPDDGVTGMKLRSGEIATVALAATSQTVTGDYWLRVDSLDEMVSGGTYMIVSVQGNAAVGRVSSWTNYKAVTLRSVKDNEKYYTIDGSDSNVLHWKITKNGNNWRIQNVGSTRYYLVVNNSTVVRNSASDVTLTRMETEKVWRLSYGDYTLRSSGGSFSRSEDPDTTQYKTDYYYTASMLIFRLVEDTELTIRDDVNDGLMDDNTEEETAPAQPDFRESVTPDAAKTGDTAVVDPTDDTVRIEGEYFSDPATSDIEKYFQYEKGTPFAEIEHNDGRVMTDKSVIYGSDDYGAFDSYAPNTFGVTLSAIGQDYKTPYTEYVQTPVDVVFIIDISGSMTRNGVNGSDKNRIANAVAATNQAIATVMKEENSRVGVAVYTGGAWEILPMDRYTATDDQFFVLKEGYIRKHEATGRTDIEVDFMIGGPTLKNSKGESFADVGLNLPQGIGTFTQGGIAMAEKIFEDVPVEDTTFTTKVGFGAYERDYSVQRQPVFILLSDGEPTYSTTNYMDPMSGPFYGDGNGGKDNAKGVHGYYTVLTANYAKRQVGIHYQKEATFFTIGMGIKADSDEPNANSGTGENYKRAVLNPEREIIENLTSTTNKATTVDQLRQMLLNQYTGGNVTVLAAWPEDQLGIPHSIVPVLQDDPYYEDFSYANDAYFGEIKEDELAQIFNDIIEGSLKTSSYGFILYKNSSIQLHDNIGEGMEIKGTPVLHYNGVNYSNPTVVTNGDVTQYVYNETYVDPYVPGRTIDVSQVLVQVTKNADGTQSVAMIVPDEVLPTYTPELIGQQYYYEALPVRLIYQVGLTAESEQAVLNLLETGGELTFYANRWDTDENTASSDLYPSKANPYYQEVNEEDDLHPYYQEHHDAKSENATNTREHYADCNCSVVDGEEENEKIMRIHHYLGNNGKLVFSADNAEIPVEKQWRTESGDLMPPVTMELYKVTTSELGYRVGTLVSSIELSADGGWKGKFTDLAIPTEDWSYAIVERYVNGFQTYYRGATIRFSVDGAVPIIGVDVDMKQVRTTPVTITNVPEVELPDTGGIGDTPFVWCGALTMLASGTIFVLKRKKKHE